MTDGSVSQAQKSLCGPLATHIFVTYVGAGSKTVQFYAVLVAQHKQVYTLDLPANAHLVQRGVMRQALHNLGALL